MSKPKNKIVYKKPGKDAYDSPGLHGCLNDEFGQFESGLVKLPKDYMRVKNVKILNPDGTTSKLKFPKPKKKK